MLHISLAADKIIKIGNVYLTNTVLATWATMAVLIVFAWLSSYYLKKGKYNFLVTLSKIIVKSFFNFINSILEEEKLSWQVLPLVSTLFIYITTANWLALVPGFIGSFVIHTKERTISIFRSINADLNTTFAMAITSIILIKLLTWKFKEAKNYLRVGVNKVFRVIIIFFEDLSEFTRVLSLSFRLSGNVFSGEVLMLVLAFLTPFFIPIPFMFLEFFIGLFQALVFSVLVLIFVKW